MVQNDNFNTGIASAYGQEQLYKHIPHPPIIVTFSAVPGSGKTTLAKKLMRDLQAQYVNHDDIREVISKRGIDPQGIFIPDISRIVINRMVKNDENKLIILDASLDRSWKIYYDHVKELKAMPIVIRLAPSVNTIRERLHMRDGENGKLADQLDRFISEFENCCRHVKADITIGDAYDYTQVLQAIKAMLDQYPKGVPVNISNGI